MEIIFDVFDDISELWKQPQDSLLLDSLVRQTIHTFMGLMKKKMEKMQEMFTKDPEELKNKQKEMNNTLEGINSRITEAEEKTYIVFIFSSLSLNLSLFPPSFGNH